MNHIHRQVEIDAPVEHVFELVGNVEKHRKWNPNKELFSVCGPLNVVGTTYDSILDVAATSTPSSGMVVDVKPLQLILMRETSGHDTSNWGYRFERSGTKTVFTVDIDYERSGLLAGVVDRLVWHGALENAAHRMVEELKSMAEATVPAHA
jgi:uncharacterized protein YndB with AHSA1/START domain